MKYLLDTHTLLWFLADDKKLSRSARLLIENASHESVVSVASLWEIAVKTGLGKLHLERPFDQMFPDELHLNHIETLDITIDSLIKLTTIPYHHRDPFDRLIIAVWLRNFQ